MPNETEFVIGVEADDARIRVRFVTNGALVVSFMVQLETLYGVEWKPVRRCDDYHGRPHMDALDRRGREYRKEWLDVDRNTALTMSIQDFKTNWRRYLAEFLKDDARD